MRCSKKYILCFAVMLTGLTCISCGEKSPTETEKHANVVLLGEIEVRDWYVSWYTFIEYRGYVKNIGNKEAKDVRIHIWTYNRDNKLIASDYDNIGNLVPENVRGFTVTSSLGLNEYHHHEYHIWWR